MLVGVLWCFACSPCCSSAVQSKCVWRWLGVTLISNQASGLRWYATSLRLAILRRHPIVGAEGRTLSVFPCCCVQRERSSIIIMCADVTLHHSCLGQVRVQPANVVTFAGVSPCCRFILKARRAPGLIVGERERVGSGNKAGTKTSPCVCLFVVAVGGVTEVCNKYAVVTLPFSCCGSQQRLRQQRLRYNMQFV